MDKEKILFGIIGLLVGIIVGFTVTNNINRDTIQTIASTNTEAKPTEDSNLPPNHPPVGENDDQMPNATSPQITEAIEKAKQNTNDFEAQMTAGDLYYQIQKFEDATVFYEQANKLRPDEFEPIAKLGNANFDLENFVEAEKWYEKALQKNPKDLNVRTDYALAFFLRTPRDIERAIKEHKITLGIDANHELTLQNLAIAYKEQKDTENMLQTLERLKKVNPDNPTLTEINKEQNQAKTPQQ